ncbi:pseudouridine-5'-phosphatase-like [Mya arenaria]|uniref:pseudouridine-5'-phosphatase-like n=1 Tax=Mya arenaria TaxID=6604 RepID=UPI0022E6C9D8|nr:pseudouridine-5'-phosphatase-like [Mya arenaria]
MTNKAVTHVLFDVDGLLLDTERLYTEATQKLCDCYGKQFTWDVKKQVMGKKEPESAKMIVDMLKLPMTVEQYIEDIHKEYDTLFPTVPLLPGADKLIRHLHQHKVPIAVVTGSNTKSFELKSANHKEFFSLFHHLVLSGDDPEVKHGKPAPDAFLVGAQRFNDGIEPSKVLVFEDAMNGVEAAHAAGMPCVWVPHAEQDRSVMEGKTELILDSLEHFKPEDFGLPPYDS